MPFNTQKSSTSRLSNPPDLFAGPFIIRGVQTQEALCRFAGDQERYRHWLTEFILHGPEAATQIRQAITNGAHEIALRLTHSFKGRTGVLGMTELYSIALSLEKALREKDSTVLWLEELELTVDEMSKEISSVLGGNAP